MTIQNKYLYLHRINQLKQKQMETKHTKGKWEISVQGKNRIFILAKNPTDIGRDAVCRIYTENSHEHSSEANAKLIAVAPELLDALINVYKNTLCQLIATCDNSWNKIELEKQAEQIENAIKKATE